MSTIVGHFSMSRTVPQSFVDQGPKLRVLILAKWNKPDMAKNRDEPPTMTHTSETENFFGVVRMEKL